MEILTPAFIASQVLVFFALGFDFLSMQYKKRKYTLLCLLASASLISVHYFLLSKVVAGIIILVSVARYMVCYRTINKKFLYLFLGINTVIFIITYAEVYDIVIYLALLFSTIGVFQKDNQLLRKLIMLGTSLLVVYNLFIFSPMAVLVEGSFLVSNFIGYYRHYLRKK
ncbi:MAG: YgjV family protein [Parcubacteria group bacterium]|nr:YgjV family protein [Parcubacteria group bacterium]